LQNLSAQIQFSAGVRRNQYLAPSQPRTRIRYKVPNNPVFVVEKEILDMAKFTVRSGKPYSVKMAGIVKHAQFAPQIFG
jgi:hypothetical protein